MASMEARAVGVLFTVLLSSCGGGGGSAPPAQTPAPVAVPPPAATPPPSTPTAPANREPIVANAIQDQRGIGGHAFSYDFTQGGTTFADPDGDPLHYDVWMWDRTSPAPANLTVAGTTIAGILPAEGWIEVHIEAQDGRGPSMPESFVILIDPNSAPVVSNPNLAVMTSPGEFVDYDPTQGGTTFTDADGDVLSYQVAVLSDPKGLAITGLNVVGALHDVGLVELEITARDDYGGSSTDRFAVAIAGPEPGEPTLPAVSFVYADEELPLPWLFRMSSGPNLGAFWNMTPQDNLVTNAGATLGRVLFYDKRLSITNTHACGSCHVQAKGFAGAARFDIGVQGLPLPRNTMGLVNARYNFVERWFSDLRAASLEELAVMPIEEPTELGNFLPTLEEKLAATEFYPQLFEAAFASRDVTAERIAQALAQFLRSMISYRTKFDRAYSTMDGSEPNPAAVLDARELHGLEVYIQNPGTFCRLCHMTDVQTMNFATNNGLDSVLTDPGAGNGVFRAASLRNIAVTGPYMHDGRFATLREVIDHYDHGVQGSREVSDILMDRDTGLPKRLNLSEYDKEALEAFLRTLTDEEFLNDPKYSDPFR
jgi:cytochrome c peroxidase